MVPFDNYFVKAALNESEGVYYVTAHVANEADATHFVPVSSGKVVVKGLEDDTYPYAQGFLVKREMKSTAQTFQEQKETQPTTSVMIPDSTEPTEQWLYPELWKDMTAYNEEIFKQGQSGLSCKLDYQQPSFRLADYGLKEEVFGVITISPPISTVMPLIRLAANVVTSK